MATQAMPLTPRRHQRRLSASSGVARPSAPSGIERRPTRPPRSVSSERNVLIAQRHRTDTLARCREVGVEHGRRRDADGRLADAPPKTAARHDDRFHLRHLGNPHRIVVVEIRLLDAAVLDGASAIEQPGQAIDERAGDLALDLRGIDDIDRIGASNYTMSHDIFYTGHRDLCTTSTLVSTSKC